MILGLVMIVASLFVSMIVPTMEFVRLIWCVIVMMVGRVKTVLWPFVHKVATRVNASCQTSANVMITTWDTTVLNPLFVLQGATNVATAVCQLRLVSALVVGHNLTAWSPSAHRTALVMVHAFDLVFVVVKKVIQGLTAPPPLVMMNVFTVFVWFPTKWVSLVRRCMCAIALMDGKGLSVMFLNALSASLVMVLVLPLVNACVNGVGRVNLVTWPCVMVIMVKAVMQRQECVLSLRSALVLRVGVDPIVLSPFVLIPATNRLVISVLMLGCVSAPRVLRDPCVTSLIVLTTVLAMVFAFIPLVVTAVV
jgi:hypothetical protein